jgi:hypothetical protein
METKAVNNKPSKPFIIANPIYDTALVRLMENQQVAKFFISTILEQPVEDLTVQPQEVTYEFDETKVSPGHTKDDIIPYYYYFRSYFMATVRDAGGKLCKILIEIQKSWDMRDVKFFHKYIEQYKRVCVIDREKTVLPIVTIYIFGKNLPEIDCPCIKIGHIYTDMTNKRTIDAKPELTGNFPNDSYIIQAGRIADVRYTTNLDKLLSIFEQRYFIDDRSDTRKEYPYQLDDENMELITDILYETGHEQRKLLEDEKEFVRIINNIKYPVKY